MPPGIAITASDSSAISALRSCIVSTTCSLVRPAWATSSSTSRVGITPIAVPPAAERAVGERSHQTRRSRHRRRARARARPAAGPAPAAPATYSGRAPGLEPQKTRTRFIGTSVVASHRDQASAPRGPSRHRGARRAARQALDQDQRQAAGHPPGGVDGRPDDARGRRHPRQGSAPVRQGRVPGPDDARDPLRGRDLRLPIARGRRRKRR